MDTQQLILELVRVLAWPVAVVGAIYLIKSVLDKIDISEPDNKSGKPSPPKVPRVSVKPPTGAQPPPPPPSR